MFIKDHLPFLFAILLVVASQRSLGTPGENSCMPLWDALAEATKLSTPLASKHVELTPGTKFDLDSEFPTLEARIAFFQRLLDEQTHVRMGTSMGFSGAPSYHYDGHIVAVKPGGDSTMVGTSKSYPSISHIFTFRTIEVLPKGLGDQAKIQSALKKKEELEAAKSSKYSELKAEFLKGVFAEHEPVPQAYSTQKHYKEKNYFKEIDANASYHGKLLQEPGNPQSHIHIEMPKIFDTPKSVFDTLAAGHGAAAAGLKGYSKELPDLFDSENADQTVMNVEELVTRVEQQFQLKPHPIAVAKAKKVKDIPFEDFLYGNTKVSYSGLNPLTKKTTNGSPLIYFGRKPAVTEANAMASITRYFTEGLARSGGHHNVALHQASDEGAARSGFSNGSESMKIAKSFAGDATGWGVVYIMDTSGQDILNLVATRAALGRDDVFSTEKEILHWGSRAPQRVVGALLFENGSTRKFFLNPNYKPQPPKQP